MNDPISDMLTRIRNANGALLPLVNVPHSKLKESIATILKREGYIHDFSVEGNLPKTLKLKLKYQGKKSVIEGLQRVSRELVRIHYSKQPPQVRGPVAGAGVQAADAGPGKGSGWLPDEATWPGA